MRTLVLPLPPHYEFFMYIPHAVYSEFTLANIKLHPEVAGK